VWSRADPQEGINFIVALIPMLEKVPGGRMLDDTTKDEDCSVPIGKGLSSLWMCANPEEATRVIGVSRHGTGYTAETKRKLKSAAAGGDRRVCVGSRRSSVGDTPRAKSER
jgi:hypothetical protein